MPNQAALTAIAQHAPRGVVEIGAGGGYWAHELRRAGVDVIAYDLDPNGEGGWHVGPWSRVHLGDQREVCHHADRTLLLCWPNGDWARRAVDLYRGDTVVYVGQDSDRPTQLRDPALVVDIPRWADVDDRLEVYRR